MDASCRRTSWRSNFRRCRVGSSFAPGWDAAGISEGRLLNSSLQLTRRVTAGATERMAVSQRFAPFVRIHRRCSWVSTDGHDDCRTSRAGRRRVHVASAVVAGRVSADTGPAGRRRGRARVDAVGREQRRLGFGAGARRPAAMGRSGQRPAVGRAVGSRRQPDLARRVLRHTGDPAERGFRRLRINQFLPRPGETLDLLVVRPAASAGDTVAVDSLNVRPASAANRGYLAVFFLSQQSRRTPRSAASRRRSGETCGRGRTGPVAAAHWQCAAADVAAGSTLRLRGFSTRRWYRSREPRAAGGSGRRRAPTSILTLALPPARWILFAWGRGDPSRHPVLGQARAVRRHRAGARPAAADAVAHA